MKKIFIAISLVLIAHFTAIAGEKNYPPPSPPASGSNNPYPEKIYDGNSEVNITDDGSGQIGLTVDGEEQVRVTDGVVAIINGLSMRPLTTTADHGFSIGLYDSDSAAYEVAVEYLNGDDSDSDPNNQRRAVFHVPLSGFSHENLGIAQASDISTNLSITNGGMNKYYRVTAQVTVTLDTVNNVTGGSETEANPGDELYFEVRDAGETLTIDCDASDKINFQGIVHAAGVSITLAGMPGTLIKCRATTDADGSGTNGWLIWHELYGQVYTIAKSANYTLGTDTITELFGGTFYVTSAATITAAAVQPGCSFAVHTVGAIAVSVDVNASDLIVRDGTAQDDGDKIDNNSTAGDSAVFKYYSADGWFATTDGWTDGG